MHVFPAARRTDDGTLKRVTPSLIGTGAKLVKSTSGRLYKATFVNTTAARWFVHVYDKATSPVNNEVPIWVDGLAQSTTGNGATTIDFGMFGLYCANGIWIAASAGISTLTYLAGDTVCVSALYS